MMNDNVSAVNQKRICSHHLRDDIPGWIIFFKTNSLTSTHKRADENQHKSQIIIRGGLLYLKAGLTKQMQIRRVQPPDSQSDYRFAIVDTGNSLQVVSAS